MEARLTEILQEKFQTGLEQATNEQVYYALLTLTKERIKEGPKNEGKRKLYYISAEFLIGKLLSNNLINLGIYDETAEVLKKHGKNLAEIEEVEPEPSLGNGGLGRLAACFLDSIATLGLPGDGIGLNYHMVCSNRYLPTTNRMNRRIRGLKKTAGSMIPVFHLKSRSRISVFVPICMILM